MFQESENVTDSENIYNFETDRLESFYPKTQRWIHHCFQSKQNISIQEKFVLFGSPSSQESSK